MFAEGSFVAWPRVARTRYAVVAATLLALTAAPAFAQAPATPRSNRIFASVNFGAQMKSQEDATHFGFDLFFEQGSVDVARTVKGGSFPDLTAGMLLFDRLGVAVNLMERTAKSDGTLTASLPDPVFYDAPQALSGAVSAAASRALARRAGRPSTAVDEEDRCC